LPAAPSTAGAFVAGRVEHPNDAAAEATTRARTNLEAARRGRSAVSRDRCHDVDERGPVAD
jgi:hypothetical protein